MGDGFFTGRSSAISAAMAVRSLLADGGVAAAAARVAPKAYCPLPVFL